MTAPGAVLAVARHELTRRWRSYVALGLLAGLVAAMVVSTFVLLRRTATAYDRLEAATHAEEARVNVYNGPTPPPEIQRLPGVAKTEVAKVAVGALEGRGQVLYTAITSVPRFDGDLFTPVVVAGRAVDPRRPDEVLIEEQLARENGIHPGMKLHLRMLTLDQVRRFDVGFGAPAGPPVTLTVVGLMRLPSTESSNSPVIAGPAFARSMPPGVFAATVIVRLRHGTHDVPRFAAALDRLATRLFPSNDVFVPLQPSYPSDGRPRVAATTRVLVSGLALIAAVSALAGLVVFAQATGRLFAAGATDQQVESALGLTPWQRVAARLVPGCATAAVAAVIAVVAGTAAGLLEPLGALRRLEPHPNWAPNWAVSILGASSAIAVVLVATAVASWRAGRPPAAAVDARRSSLARLSAYARRGWSSAGVGFAFGGARGGRRVPLRTVLAGVVVGIAGVVAASVFVASLHRLTTEPPRYGWTADFDVADARNAATSPTVDRLVHDPRVEALAVSGYTTVRIERVDVDGYWLEQRRGHVDWTLLHGRMPRRVDEVVLGTRLAHRLHRGVGDVVNGVARNGQRMPLRVVGVGLGPDLNSERLGQQVLLTSAALDRIGQSDIQTDALVRLRRGVDAAAFESGLGRTVEVDPRVQPADVQNLDQLGRLPDVLVAFLAIVAAAALLHGLVTTVRRRRRDIGVLRALGFTPNDARASIVTAGLTIALIGLAIGMPLGLSLGRLVWALVADATGVATDVSVPWLRLALLVPAALVVTLAVSLIPGRDAARMRPAAVLRTE